MITLKINGDNCESVSLSSTSKLFEFLFGDKDFQLLRYHTYLVDSGVYIVDSHGTKILRMECPEGKKALLDELAHQDIDPEMVLDTYLLALFNILDAAKVLEKVSLDYYVLGRIIQPTRIEVKEHPAGFRKGVFTLFDEIIARNYQRVKLGAPRKLIKVRYNPVNSFASKVVGNAILIFSKENFKELAILHFDSYRTAKGLSVHTADAYLTGVFFGYLKFKLSKFFGYKRRRDIKWQPLRFSSSRES